MKIWINVYAPGGNYVAVHGYTSKQLALEHVAKGCIAEAVQVEFEEGAASE